ncbi:IS5/IS1182 family transposase [Pseudomonas mosselii]|uniref:IS5/IS1182 family transposase n=2 Tax=Pseudomonas mosselii TaxID=78327 RepID=UPI00078153BC|nr:IS5/IS1182 family transposase [Pseudomonas mosselii]
MSQMSFSDFEYAGKRKQTRRERFLAEMEQVVPWSGLVALIEPYYPKAGGGRKPYPLETMLRIHLLQTWFSLSDPAMEEALYEITSMRQFARLTLSAPIPEDTTIMNFRHLLHGDENIICADAGYTGVEKRPEHDSRQVIWQIAARRSTYKHLSKRSVLYKAKRQIEKVKAQTRAKVEPPFRVIKRQFGYVETRFRGLAKNTAQLTTLFALSNLWMVRRQLLTAAGEVRP